MVSTSDINPDTGKPFTAFEASAQTQVSNQGKPGYDPLGNYVGTDAQTPHPQGTAPASGTPSPYYSRYSNMTTGEQAANDYLGTFTAPRSEDQIVADKTKAAQGQIDSLNKYYDNLVAEQKTINEGRTRSTNSVSVLSGLAGSTEANVAANKTTELNSRDLEKVNNERNLQIQTVLGNIRSAAATEAQTERTNARQSATDILAARTARQTEANTQLTSLAKTGVTPEGLKTHDPQSYDYLVRNLGGEEQVKALFTLNIPKEAIHDTKIENGKYIVSYQNPLTGKIRIETLDLGLPSEYDKTMDAGDRVIAFPKYWDGDPSKLITINKGLTPDQAAKNGEGASGDSPQLYAGLNSKTATAIRQKVTNFKAEPVVQNFAVIQEGRNFAGSLSNDTKNPADDQALIYALAKALDPGSVVREGEYATAQKYAQSWVNAYGKGITQALLGTGFLSKQARTNIKDTIEARYKASKGSYDNLYTQYSSGINALTGRGNGSQFLTDYATPVAGSGISVSTPDGQSFTFPDQASADAFKKEAGIQ